MIHCTMYIVERTRNTNQQHAITSINTGIKLCYIFYNITVFIKCHPFSDNLFYLVPLIYIT